MEAMTRVAKSYDSSIFDYITLHALTQDIFTGLSCVEEGQELKS
jgi:hypothetical protein